MVTIINKILSILGLVMISESDIKKILLEMQAEQKAQRQILESIENSVVPKPVQGIVTFGIPVPQ
jgi:hypothetical protein